MSQAQEIIEAAQTGNVSCVESLLKTDPRLAGVRSRGCGSPLHYAAKNGHIAIMKLLLNDGASVSDRDHGAGATPLHWAAATGQIEAAGLLLDHGADPNGEDELHRQPPIGWATALSESHEAMAEFLLAWGAKLNVFAAVAMGREDALREMVRLSMERASRSEFLIASNRETAFRRMVRSDPTVLNARMSASDDQRQPLHLAVIKGRNAMIGVLLDLGADLHAKTASGRTALCIAAESHRSDLVNQLLSHGAEIDEMAAQALGRIDRATALLHPAEPWSDDLEPLSSESVFPAL
jgi:ankyrin repeat protein